MQCNKLSIPGTTAIVLIHTAVQFVLLPTISIGGLMGLKTVFEWGIALLISGLLVLVSIAGDFIPKIRGSFRSLVWRSVFFTWISVFLLA